MIKLICEQCSSSFLVSRPSIAKKRKYCSRQCAGKSRKGKPNLKRRTGIYKKCETCGKEFYAKAYRKDKRKFCSRKCGWESKKGKSSWSKGLTKEMDERLKKASETRKRLLKEGKLKIWIEGLTKETDERVKKIAEKTSKRNKKAYAEGRATYGFKKGHKTNVGQESWCKNLTKETDERVRKIAEKIQKKYDDGTASFGFKKGEKHSKEDREKISKRLKKLHREGKLKIWCDGKKRPKHSKRMREKYKRGEWIPPVKVKNFWKDPEYREKAIRATLKAFLKRPTKLEKQFNNFFIKYILPLTYCGDGSLLIGFRNPDYFESNGKKICVEVANKKEKSVKRKNRKYQSWQEYENRRITHFAKYGWRCLVLWQEELKNEQTLLNKIKNFLNG